MEHNEKMISRATIGALLLLVLGFTALVIHPERITAAAFIVVVATYVIAVQLSGMN